MATANETQQRLNLLRNALLRLHTVLLESEQRAYERDIERIATRGQLLNLVLGDPWFAYLRRLSEMVVRIDEAVDAKEPLVTEADADAFLVAARALVTPSEEGQGFAKRYFEALQNDPAVVIAHSELLKSLEELVRR